MIKNAVMRYLVYIVYFLGIGMVSSGIVLMPFNAMRYGIILVIGLLLFSTGSFFNEVVLEKKQMTHKERLKLVLVSLCLAIGIGMISGGIAHFKESPVYVSFLIPLGIIISFVSFMVKNGYKLHGYDKLITAIVLVVVTLVIHTGLSFAASQISADSNGGDIFKGHGM